MKIGIDARMYGPRSSGLGRYSEQLIKNLEKIDSKNDYVIFLNKENFDSYIPQAENFRKVLADISWYSFAEQTKFVKILYKEKLDLMHFTHFNVPFFYRKKFIVTIHDLIMYHFPRPEATTKSKIIFFIKDKIHRLVLQSACRQAEKILTTSDFSRRDIVKFLKIKPEKIQVIYQAPFCVLKNVSNPEILQKLNLVNKKYFIYVGNAYPHKNLENLVKAWNIFKDKNNLENYYLLLVGRKNYFYDRLLKNLDFIKSQGIIYADFVSDEELQTLYENSEAYIFPSLYEGFGLPPLEAMFYGIPVLSSNASSLPEILADSSLYFDPLSVQNIADVIEFFVQNKDLQMELQQKSREHVKYFSSEKLARETLEEYNKIKI
ncbi:MAG: glycosyltransferase family 1 protein [Patescibacteria group bacterium]